MKLKLSRVLVASMLAAMAFGATAAPGKQRQADALLASVAPNDPAVLALEPAPRAKLEAEDMANDFKHGVPLRYGVNNRVENVVQDGLRSEGGVWSTLADGSQRWTLKVDSADAVSLEFTFAKLRLPAGAVLSARSLSDKGSHFTLTDADNPAAGRYYTRMIAGPDALLQLTLSASKREFLALELEGVTQGYRDPIAALEFAKSGSCNIDTICPQGDAWRNQIASVAHYSFQRPDGSFVCTGQLMATGDTAADRASPRFSTANHCVNTASHVQSMVFYWGYESPTCRAVNSGASGTSLSRNANTRATQSGATLLATHQPTDWTAVQLSNPVPAAAQPYYSGWDRSGQIPQGSVSIHHPAGHEKRITFNDDPLTISASCIVSGTPADTHWRVSQYEAGTTEGGSSGGGLWDKNSKLLVGVLSGGDASCARPQDFDCYGRLSKAWEAGGTPQSRMRDWFDRTGANPQSVPGAGSCAAPEVTLASDAFNGSAAAGANLTFNASVAGSGSGITFLWDLDGDGITDRSGTQSSVVASYPRAGSFQVRVTARNAENCEGSATRALDVAGPAIAATAGAAQQVCGDNDGVLEPGERWSVPVTLRNNGARALGDGARALFVRGTSQASFPFGPNSSGYVGTSSTAGGQCSYSFVDIAAGDGSVPALPTQAVNNTFGPNDDARTVNAITLGGTGFELYGQRYTQAVMSTNGYVSFSTAETGGVFDNTCSGALGTGGAGPQLRVLHDDLVVSGQPGAGLRYRYFASCPRAAESDATPQGCHVFQWNRMQHYDEDDDIVGDFDFQAIAYERTGQIAYQYRTAPPDNGASSTIGITSAAGTDPLNAACDIANAAPAQSAVCLFKGDATPSGAGLRVEVPAVAVPSIAAGGQTVVNVPIAIPTAAQCGNRVALNYIATAAPDAYSYGESTVFDVALGANGNCQISNACAAQVPAINARRGLYSNPQRGGNGLANFIYGTTYGGAWYTALPDRTPTWYILTGDYADNLATIPITRVRNTVPPNAVATTNSVVGRAWVAQIDPDTLMYAWTLDGQSTGAELMKSQGLPFTSPNHTQTWFAPSQSGWGLAIESLQADPANVLEFIGAYIYDNAGVARWLTGSSNNITGGPVALTAYEVHCPGCPRFPDWGSTGQAAGSLTRTYSGPTQGTLSTAITLPAPMAGQWIRNDLPIITIGAPLPASQATTGGE